MNNSLLAKQAASLATNLEQDSSDDSFVNAAALLGKRVLLFFPHMITPGGALIYALSLAEQLLANGAAVAIVTLRFDASKCKIPHGLEVINLQGPFTSSLGYWLLFPYWQLKINKAVAAWQPDVLVPQVFPSNWWGWLCKRNHVHAKLVWICQEPSAFIHSMVWIRALQPRWKSLLARVLRPLLKAIDLSLVRYSDRILANSSFTAGEIERAYGRIPDGIAYPGIDFDSYSAGTEHKEPAVITVARLTRFKRVDFLLEVFKKILKFQPDLTYHIVGTGDEEDALRDQARRLEIEAQIVFHGSVAEPDLHRLNQRALLFLHGSIDEPFGMAPLEAIACGTPVVAHCSGGPVEFVTAECGRLIESREIADWVRAIVGYLEALRAGQGDPSVVRGCAQRFDWAFSLRPAVAAIAEMCEEAG